MTFEERLSETNNRPAGFDYLRITLAVAVIISHAPLICYGWAFHREWVSHPLVRPLIFFIVPSFFALSGFLVAGSLERNPLSKFLTLRGVRIFPALAAEILLSALLIGPLVTNFSRSGYFSDPLFFRYFMNVVGHIQYFLPGVFTTNPAPDYVNLQLWTVPRELECYILISAVSIIGLYKRPWILFVALSLTCAAIVFYQQAFRGYLEHDGQARGALPVLSFLCGVALFGLRRSIPLNAPLFGLSAAAVALCLSLPDLTFVSPFAIAYVTVFIGLQDPARIWLVRGADYSYGMYLYGFPIQQMISWAFPWSRIWYINIALAVAAAAVCALLSWTLIEKPIHDRRNKITRLVEQLVEMVRSPSRRIAEAKSKK
jgi:peptidoglycan/LPS O-acetylase OafA/YrhL